MWEIQLSLGSHDSLGAGRSIKAGVGVIFGIITHLVLVPFTTYAQFRSFRTRRTRLFGISTSSTLSYQFSEVR